MEQLAEMQRRSKPETASIPLELRDLFAVIPMAADATTTAAADSDNDEDEDPVPLAATATNNGTGK